MFEIFTETLEQIVTKNHKILFLNRKEDKYTKSEIFTFLRKSAESKAIAFDKINRNCAFYGNSINIHLRVFLLAEFISAMKTGQNPTIFMKTEK